MALLSGALTKQKLCLDFAHLKYACPKGVYVAPVPDEGLRWVGVLFVRKGPYANATLRFQMDFPEDYPHRPPVVTFVTDVFHPLVTPLTTYTYSTRDFGGETVSAADRDRLPPGGLSLRHSFPEWYDAVRDSNVNKEGIGAPTDQDERNAGSVNGSQTSLLTVQVLQYLRIAFDTEAILDAVPLEAAANAGAWHAWRSYRTKMLGGRASPMTSASSNASDGPSERSTSPRQQPGGARRPGEWNWQGVWEDRVKKSIQASTSDHMLYGSDHSDLLYFSKVDPETITEMKPSWRTDAFT